MEIPKVSAVPKRFFSRIALMCAALFFASDSWAQPGAYGIEGADAQLERNIRTHVTIPNLECNSSQRRLSRFSTRVDNQVLRAGRALGYYGLESTVLFEFDEECWTMNIVVEPGERITVSAIDIEIINEPRLFRTVTENLPMEVGDSLNQADYERIKSNLSSQAIDVGFFAARFEKSQLLLDLQTNTAAVEIDFNPGRRYKFGSVEIEAQDALSEEFVHRYVNFDSNSDYSSSALIDLRNALSDSQYFSDVTVTPALERALIDDVPIQVGLKMRPRRSYSAGAGLTTDIGPRVTFDFEDRYLNEDGHKVDLGVSTSPLEQTLDANYLVPWRNPATENFRFSTGFLNEDNDTFRNSTLKLSAAYSTLNRWGWQQNLYTSYQHDEFDINEQTEVADVLLTGLSMAKTRADDALYPSKGWRLFGQIQGASSALLSTESFLQLNLNGKLISKLGPGRLLTKFELGTILSNDATNLPISLLYFAGGDQSVRGYQYQSLGQENELGEIVGGKHQIVGSVEYDFNIRPEWKLAVFADAGNAFEDFNDFQLKKSVGIGIRWLSPIGPIRADLASALDDDNKLRLHITMGPDL